MTGSPALSRFTPSLMPHALLERLFVGRTHLLSNVMKRIEAAAASEERNHTLIVGPRGSGKTHLVALAYYRTKQLTAAGTPVQLSWLPEDAWTIVSYRHLLHAIVERLEPAIEEATPKSAHELETLLSLRGRSSGPIVVVVENLDRILAAIENEGQQRLRHLLQVHRSLLIVATSTRLDRSLSDQGKPFYGFFTTSRLEPLDVHTAAAMLTAIAQERDDEALSAYLGTDEARGRLGAVAHLAGGQPRIWSALASALTVRGLDELVDLLLTRFDDLTPYYQEQLARLSGQQRLMVAQLAEADRPVNVSELAALLALDPRSLGKTASELVDRGWIVPTDSPVVSLIDKRRTYYELAEPLARLAFQLKDSRGEPLRLIVDFLKHWFDPHDLQVEALGPGAEYLVLAASGQGADAVIAVTRQLRRLPLTRAPAVELLGELDDALSALSGGDAEPFLRLPSPVRAAVEDRLVPGDESSASQVRLDIHRAAGAEFGDVPHPAMAKWIARAEDLIQRVRDSDRGRPALNLADWLSRTWRFTSADAVLAATTALLGADHPGPLTSRNNLAGAYETAGRLAEAIDLYEQTRTDRERILGPDHPNTLTSRNNLAGAYETAGRLAEAIDLYEQTRTDAERILGPDHPNTLTSRNNLAGAYQSAGRLAEAIDLYEQTRTDAERILGPDHPNTLTSRNNLAGAYQSAGRLAEAIDLYEQTRTDAERILGPDHPNTLTSRNNLAGAYQSAGRLAEAIDLYEQTRTDAERILGPDHPNTLTSRNNLAGAYQSAGRLAEAIDLYEQTRTDRERILGPDPPDT